ncbi:HTTM domain-containing protein [Hymenobacter sp. GOD-10R]|uniref:HTTM domain-containing protein n=1 Tax=Hymenobacter sp. GOD-10R TaxID=3093922 RepID=UPI002D794931|nr:HTTM domain-containing protein [Hymenobacter sp. GOD-10R]WRQ29550.1 HTTM domain-containing protein [Hymenobacter sp. GOD-10R]
MLRRLTTCLFRPIDIAWLVVFRISAGSLLALEQAGSLALGYSREYTEPRFHFSYLFTQWLPVPPPVGMYGLHLLAILGGIGVAAGWRYRASAAALWLAYTWLFLVEQTRYINHFYLYCLVAGWLFFIPAHRAASADVRTGRVSYSAHLPNWTRLVLLFQLSVVYLYAGLAKLNTDWLTNSPLVLWLQAKSTRPVVGPLLAQPWLPPLMSYAGLAFDLLVVPALLWRRTRPWAFGAAAFFHLSNVVIFGLGTFPWFSLLMTVSVFFSPSWPRHLGIRRVRRWFEQLLPTTSAQAHVTLPNQPGRTYALAIVLLSYALLQLLVPLRHFLYPGSVHWTEEGHHFAWHMMLRTKSGGVSYRVRCPDGHVEVVQPAAYLTPRQCRKLLAQPDAILQFAHFLAAEYARRGIAPVAVYADSWVQLNHRAPRPLIRPDVDLAAQPRKLGHYAWITDEK